MAGSLHAGTLLKADGARTDKIRALGGAEVIMVLNTDGTDFSADLFRVGVPKLLRRRVGELMCRHAQDVCGHLHMRFEGLEIPEESVVSVVIDGEVVCEVLIHDGRGEFELRCRRGDDLPELSAGQVIEIRFEKEALLRGTVRSA